MNNIHKSYLIVFLVVVMGIIGTTVVLGQTSGEITLAIENGINYLDDQESIGSEILLLYLVDSLHPQWNLKQKLRKYSLTLAYFDYPTKQFILEEPIVYEEIHQHTLDTFSYPEWIKLFNCDPLSQEWIGEVYSWENDTITDQGDFKTAHSLIFLSWMRSDYSKNNDRCGKDPLVGTLDVLIDQKIIDTRALVNDQSNFDAWLERVAILNAHGDTTSSEHVLYILNRQQLDGGWKSNEWDLESNSHTTAKAVWALAEELL